MAHRLQITWLGHSAFLVVTPAGKRLAFDPWLGNPKAVAKYARPTSLGPLDAIFVSHGHSDHLGDVIELSRATQAPVVCPFELGLYLGEKGVRDVRDMGIGGTQAVAGLDVTMTQAAHSGSVVEGGHIVYLGGATGFVLRAHRMPTIYFAGDTGLFGDMKVIGEIYRPAIAFLPIGDHYTMGPDTAAIAAQWLGVKQVVPMHWGTFPVLRGTPAELKEQLKGKGIDVLELKVGEATQ